MPDFRFLHAADIHLDSPLVGLSGVEVEPSVAERIRAAPRAAFEALIDRAIEDAVAFLVIAGDLYDGSWRDYKTGLFFAGQMGRLNEAGIPAYVLHGNHDAASQITKPLPLPDNVHVFGARKPQTFHLQELEVALHGQSFPEKAVTDNLVPGYPQPVKGAFNIGVLHTALDGAPGHSKYAPCTVEGLKAKGYDYWALGHVHRHQVVDEHPPIVFPGNIQGRHIRETGPKGACLVSVEMNAVATIDFLPFDTVRWKTLDVDVTDAGNIHAVVTLMQQSLEREAATTAGQLLSARIVLQGQTELHSQLLAGRELLAEARACALGIGDERAWVADVAVHTEPAAEAASQAKQDDALGDLPALLAEASADTELLARLQRDCSEFLNRTPHELRERSGDDSALAAVGRGDYAALVERVAPYLRARLTVGRD